MIRAAAVCAVLAGLAACAPAPPSPYAVRETLLEVGGLNGRVPFSQSLPAIEVRRADGAALVRDDWVAAEGAARAHCTEQGAAYAALPPARDYTQIRLDDGVFYFMGRCQR